MFSNGFVLLVWVSKLAIFVREIGHFLIMLRFSSRYKLARNYGFSNFSPTRQTIPLLEKR